MNFPTYRLLHFFSHDLSIFNILIFKTLISSSINLYINKNVIHNDSSSNGKKAASTKTKNIVIIIIIIHIVAFVVCIIKLSIDHFDDHHYTAIDCKYTHSFLDFCSMLFFGYYRFK
ncbi:hypothetical protein DERF_012526 [Dermatophagoides farinae]|uniref:Uncharacterized protein n=1 Tax=Dermatophagoides farinae TaxID=6954 RepID=A0A922HS72_DERFA|nr:hypothetical protein DERF_012526 [Dermatophagoides farinae]